MQIDSYVKHFNAIFTEPGMVQKINEAASFIKGTGRIFFIGNGGSNAICSHMMEDYAKIGRFQTFAFSDAALITCYANDYGYENAMAEWLKIHFQQGDLLVAISSSGESANILNATVVANERQGKVLTLSGFKKNNRLSTRGQINFHLEVGNYGIVECYHHVILHIILDIIAGVE